MISTRIFIFAILAILWQQERLTSHVILGLAFINYVATGGYYTFYLIWGSLPRDIRGAFRYVRLLLLVYMYQKRNLTVPKVFRRTALRHPQRAAIIFEDKCWTFADLENFSNRIAHFFLRAGYKPGECVALVMENRPEYVGLWLGCTKIGLVPALINSNLVGKPLLHSITAADARGIIFGSELVEAMSVACADLPALDLFCSGPLSPPSNFLPKGSVHLDAEIAAVSAEPVPESVENLTNFTDKLLYIYTSGTTGLPKAAVIKNSRFYFYCAGMYYLNALSAVKDPVFYDPLPLYHSAGGIVGVGLMMVFGCTIVIRRKFSVRNFWKDCCKYKCNGAQYIGEMCRYLLSAPETSEEKQHCVEVMFGNGLRSQIWNPFVERFGIKRIGEFYGATEGNSNVLNIDSKPGAVGFVSMLFPFVYPVRLILVSEMNEVLRGANGLAVLCKPGQPGEFVGKIIQNHPSRGFDGYLDKAATEKKIVRDVLKHGDMWFRSGDLLTMDDFGWMYFVDRMGDTYRWRGENVSTVEVESILSSVLKQQDTIVYGVEVPGIEGRAGMAAIVEPSGGLDLAHFVAAVRKHLPTYATPMFLRFVQHLDITSTFKLKKLSLQREGFNPSVIKDRLFFYDGVSGVYRQLDQCLYNDIVEMRCRL